MASDDMTFTFFCNPGKATPELALEFAKYVGDFVNQVSVDINAGVTFELSNSRYENDGIDEITVRVSTEGAPERFKEHTEAVFNSVIGSDHD